MKTVYILWLFVQNVNIPFSGASAIVETKPAQNVGEFATVTECVEREKLWHEKTKGEKITLYTVCLPK